MNYSIIFLFLGHFGKVQPGLIWTSPLPVRPRIFSIRPPSLSCKIFLGGIPHDLNPSKIFIHRKIEKQQQKLLYLGDLQERLESFGLVRLEWPNKDNIPMHRNSSNHSKNHSLFFFEYYINSKISYSWFCLCCI